MDLIKNDIPLNLMDMMRFRIIDSTYSSECKMLMLMLIRASEYFTLTASFKLPPSGERLAPTLMEEYKSLSVKLGREFSDAIAPGIFNWCFNDGQYILWFSPDGLSAWGSPGKEVFDLTGKSSCLYVSEKFAPGLGAKVSMICLSLAVDDEARQEVSCSAAEAMKVIIWLHHLMPELAIVQTNPLGPLERSTSIAIGCLMRTAEDNKRLQPDRN